jgi:quercetin dioxygenase-like cupin family protein
MEKEMRNEMSMSEKDPPESSHDGSRPPGAPLQHRRPPLIAEPCLAFDLTQELDQLHREPEWSHGQNAKTLAKYENLRMVLTALAAKVRIPEHRTEGRITIQTIQGRILVRAGGGTFDLPVGNVLTLDEGIPHDVEAVETSAFLLTIAWPAKRSGNGTSSP